MSLKCRPTIEDVMKDPGVKKALDMQNDEPVETYRGCNIWAEFDWAHPKWGEKNHTWFGQGKNIEDAKSQIDAMFQNKEIL